MKRRNFLKFLTAGAVTAAVPILLEEELWVPGKKLISIPKKITTSRSPISDNFVIDYVTGNIRFIGDKYTGVSVLDLHKYLQDCTEEINVSTVDNIIELKDNWKIDAPEYLTEGTVIQQNEIWSEIVGL